MVPANTLELGTWAAPMTCSAMTNIILDSVLVPCLNRPALALLRLFRKSTNVRNPAEQGDTTAH